MADILACHCRKSTGVANNFDKGPRNATVIDVIAYTCV